MQLSLGCANARRMVMFRNTSLPGGGFKAIIADTGMAAETSVGGVGKQSEVLRRIPVPDTTTTGGDGLGMVEGRLARLEGLGEGLRTSQTITFSAVALVGAMLLALGSWTVIRIDRLAGRIDGLAGRLDGKIDNLSARMDSRIDSLSGRIDNLSGRMDSLSGRMDGKLGDLNTKVDQLPAKINSDLLALVTTLSQAITAARQPPPQIILMPAPQPAPSTTDSAKPAPATP